MKKILRILPLISLLFACAPKPLTYNDPIQFQETQLQNGETRQTRVSAAVEEWRNSGVIVKQGQTYQITAKGRWRTHPTCNFTKPDGIGLYQGLCGKSPLYPEVIPGYSHSMLIAKIGETGQPFSIGSEYTLKAERNGKLLFRINDAINTNFDNEGFADVSIQDLSTSNTIIEQAIKPEELVVPKNDKITDPRKRTALVIGNSAYQFSPLKNPVNDAEAIAEQLRRMNFDVILKIDVNQQDMEQAIDLFNRKLDPEGQIALFYFAGHGVQVNGENYLIPLNANINRQNDVRYKAVNIGQVIGSIGESGNNLNIIILDACRDNPLPRSFRSASRGLARFESPKGTILGFATSPGTVALDGEGDHGVYTKHLLANMQKPGYTIEQVFKEVLRGVDTETNGQQIPWTESSFTGNFSFIPN